MRVHIESSYHPGRGYHLDGANKNIKFPRRRWYDSHADIIEAVERVNPGIEIV